LHPGPGFGGSCFPKDLRALIKTAQDHDVSMRILEVVDAANEIRKRAMARKVLPAFAGVLRGKTVAVLGLTFKPHTDDMREAPSIPLIMALQDRGAKVRVYDPAGMEQAKPVLPEIDYCTGPYDCVTDADAAVIVTEWEQFRALDLKRVRELMAGPVMIDLRNIYQPQLMSELGFVYSCIGRSLVHSSGQRSVEADRLEAVPPNANVRGELLTES
jgi:UDPglucose 6-dehydrogenase